MLLAAIASVLQFMLNNVSVVIGCSTSRHNGRRVPSTYRNLFRASLKTYKESGASLGRPQDIQPSKPLLPKIWPSQPSSSPFLLLSRSPTVRQAFAVPRLLGTEGTDLFFLSFQQALSSAVRLALTAPSSPTAPAVS